MHIMPYTWKQELYICFNPTENLMLLKHTICNGKCDAWYVTFPNDPRNET